MGYKELWEFSSDHHNCSHSRSQGPVSVCVSMSVEVNGVSSCWEFDGVLCVLIQR